MPGLPAVRAGDAMSVRLAELWTCDACQGVEEVEVVVSPAYLPPAGWGQVDGGDLCMDCMVERGRRYGGGEGG